MSALDPYGAPHTDEAPAPLRLPRVWLPLVALAWLALGPYFRSKSAHFGWGFFPTMAWLILLLPLAIVFCVGALRIGSRFARGAYGPGAPFWRLAPWVVAAAGYAVGAQLEIVQIGQ